MAELPPLYHGTSTAVLSAITAGGLRSPYLTSRSELAIYYAECGVDELGGEPLVLRVTVAPVELCPDRAAWAEPVMVTPEAHAAALVALAHPERVSGGFYQLADDDYEATLAVVASCRAEGLVTTFEGARSVSDKIMAQLSGTA